jgi:preprotein translocase subunit SecE
MVDVLTFFRDVREELKKVVWPSRKLIIRASIAVLIFTIFFSLYLWILDLSFVKMISLALTKF